MPIVCMRGPALLALTHHIHQRHDDIIEVSWFARVSASLAETRLAQVAQVSSGQDNTPLDNMSLCDDNRIAFRLWCCASQGSSSVYGKGARRCRRQVLSRPENFQRSRAFRRDPVSA
jgi:hypothetical protein